MLFFYNLNNIADRVWTALSKIHPFDLGHYKVAINSLDSQTLSMPEFNALDLLHCISDGSAGIRPISIATGLIAC